MGRRFLNCLAALIAALLLFRIGTAQRLDSEIQPQELRKVDANERAIGIMLQEGKVEAALRRATLAYKANPNQASIQTLLGDIYYRMADFDRADAYYRSAADANPSEARAWLGLGRLDLLGFCRRAAREKLARAYALDPRDPQVVRAYAASSGSAGSEVALLKKYLGLKAGQRRQDLESALGHIIVHEKTGNRKLGVLASDYCRYELPLCASREATFLLEASVNEGKPLRLVLDTGARGIVIHSGAARHLGLQPLVQSALDGLGNSGPTPAQTVLAETVRIGDLTYRDCTIDLSNRTLSQHADGVIGAAIFRQFLVTLDFPRKMVEVVPFTDDLPQLAGDEDDWSHYDRKIPAGMEHFIPVSQIENVILLRAQIKGAGSGHFILDTGASSSSVSRVFTPNVDMGFLGTPFMFHGAGGNVHGIYRAYPFALGFGNHSFVDPSMIALDLRAVSDREGVEISGFIGCPGLARSRIMIDYRDGLLDVEDVR